MEEMQTMFYRLYHTINLEGMVDHKYNLYMPTNNESHKKCLTSYVLWNKV